jgi:hypothetical protein
MMKGLVEKGDTMTQTDARKIKEQQKKEWASEGSPDGKVSLNGNPILASATK